VGKFFYSQGTLTITTPMDIVSGLYTERITGEQDFTIYLNPTSGDLLIGIPGVLQGTITGYILPPGVDSSYQGAGTWAAWKVNSGQKFTLNFTRDSNQPYAFSGTGGQPADIWLAPASSSVTFNYMLFTD
jgi:hypothetical protein